jgi:hypothetical protein
MVQYLFDQNIIIYTFAGLCGLGLLVRLLVNLVYKHLVRESDNPGEAKNKMLKHLKLKFETCYKLKIGVNNVDTFVDKNVLRYRFCGLLLSTWDNFCGQVLFLNLLLVPIIAVFGVFFDCGQDQIMLAGSVGILSGAVLILVDKSINLSVKKRMLRLNLLDYLENFCKVRLEQEAFHPELVEQYRREYFQVAETKKQPSAAASALAKEEEKYELNRRREARRIKEEEKKAQALKREEEQKKLEEARKEEERRRIEERKQLAAKRREEELQKMEEEKLALEARREEARRKAEEKQLALERKQQKQEQKEKILHSLEEDLMSADEKSGMEELMKEIDEIAVEKERSHMAKIEKGKADKARVDKDKLQKPAASKAKKPSLQEDKIIEDVLKEFFA